MLSVLLYTDYDCPFWYLHSSCKCESLSLLVFVFTIDRGVNEGRLYKVMNKSVIAILLYRQYLKRSVKRVLNYIKLVRSMFVPSMLTQEINQHR